MYYSHKNLTQVSNHGLILKKAHSVIKFNHNAWLKPYIDMNTNLNKKKQITILRKIFYQADE